jgi:hypothetical protein
MLPRVAIDANVLITGIVWPRWQYEILQHALRHEIGLPQPSLHFLVISNFYWLI